MGETHFYHLIISHDFDREEEIRSWRIDILLQPQLDYYILGPSGISRLNVLDFFRKYVIHSTEEGLEKEKNLKTLEELVQVRFSLGSKDTSKLFRITVLDRGRISNEEVDIIRKYLPDISVYDLSKAT